MYKDRTHNYDPEILIRDKGYTPKEVVKKRIHPSPSKSFLAMCRLNQLDWKATIFCCD